MSKITINFKCQNYCRKLNCVQCHLKSDKFHPYFSLWICFAAYTFLNIYFLMKNIRNNYNITKHYKY